MNTEFVSEIYKKTMKTSPSSSSYSHSETSLIKRRKTLFKKADELSTLCDIEVCVIHYGPDGELKTWPEDREKVKDMALRYSRLDKAKRRKKSVNLYDFQKKNKTTTISKKNMNVLKYPISDHYSPDQITELIQSLELAYSTLQERLRYVEDRQKQKETKPEHPQTKTLNPSQFSLYMYNHGDATLSQIPLSAASLFDQSALTNYSTIQEPGLKDHSMHQELNGYEQNNNFQHLCDSNIEESLLKNQLMQKELYSYDQNMCLSNINNNNFQLSTTQDYSLAVPGSVNNYGLNQSIKHELNGYDQNMCMGDTRTSNSQHPYQLYSNFQDPYSYMISNTSFPQDMSTRYDVQFGESSLLQTSTLPSSFISLLEG